MYEKLIAAGDDEITIVCIGQLRNISVFLRSEFNGHNGTDIFNQKVKELVIMGGNFAQDSKYFVYEGMKFYAEYNLATDPESIHIILKNVKKNIIFCDFNMGVDVLTFGQYSINCDKTNPVAVSYKLFQNGPRDSWDPVTVICAVLGENEYFGFKRGVVTTEKHGRTHFKKQTNGNHFVGYLKQSKKKVATYVESFLKEEL